VAVETVIRTGDRCDHLGDSETKNISEIQNDQYRGST